MKNLNFKNISIIAALIAGGLTMAGCASIMNGSTQKFTMASEPTHAHLIVDGDSVGTTPRQVHLSRKENHVVKVNLAGYQTATIPLKRTASGWIFGNVIFGGIIGIAIDVMDGSMYKLTPEQLTTHAANTGVKYTARTGTLMVVLVRDGDKNWQRMGGLQKVAP